MTQLVQATKNYWIGLVQFFQDRPNSTEFYASICSEKEPTRKLHRFLQTEFCHPTAPNHLRKFKHSPKERKIICSRFTTKLLVEGALLLLWQIFNASTFSLSYYTVTGTCQLAELQIGYHWTTDSGHQNALKFCVKDAYTAEGPRDTMASSMAESIWIVENTYFCHYVSLTDLFSNFHSEHRLTDL